MRVGFTAGGTGGHIYPAIAIAQLMPKSDVHFFGSLSREDTRIVPKEGYAFSPLSSNRKRPLPFFNSLIKAIIELRKQRIKLLISTGGFTTLPIVMAAVVLRIPIFLCEQNAIPGRSNRVMARFAKLVFLTYKESASFFSDAAKVVGNPVRKTYKTGPIYQAISGLKFSHNVLLVFGGSQGALAINQFVEQHLEALEPRFSIIWITGKQQYNALNLSSKYKKITQFTGYSYATGGTTRTIIMPYCDELMALYPLVNYVMCRSGATSLAEIAHFNKKAILIPYPHAKDNHQLANAQAHKRQFPCEIITQENLTFSQLMKCLNALDVSVTDSPHTATTLNNAAQAILNEINQLTDQKI
jgi:UDP-N-acetylglucosamine--N-acetylmuramyl-(pentapeptide) pyrophosphoryl-undecaprenol N-acetylglucosamine transferase